MHRIESCHWVVPRRMDCATAHRVGHAKRISNKINATEPMRNKLFFLLLTLWMLAACSPAPSGTPQSFGDSPYFSMERYFQQEAERLERQSPTVRKTVKKNEEAEDREVKIRNWPNELELFRLSDINMDAWVGMYEVDSSETHVEYRALDPELRTRHIVIHRSDDGAIWHIHVTNESTNMLYSTREELDYYPDSLYVIEKRQNIRWWSDNTYTIRGRIVSQ